MGTELVWIQCKNNEVPTISQSQVRTLPVGHYIWGNSGQRGANEEYYTSNFTQQFCAVWRQIQYVKGEAVASARLTCPLSPQSCFTKAVKDSGEQLDAKPA